MKVLNLRCDAGHGFEGWFASEEDFQDQTGRGLLSCPVCASAVVHRLPSAPRLNLSGARAPDDAGKTGAKAPSAGAPSSAGAGPGMVAQPATAVLDPRQRDAAEALWLQAVKQVLAHTEDVGRGFAEEARRIHHGDVEHRAIRGQATADEARALSEEGIEVFALPIPDGLEGPVH